ncbi:hypothetical protein [Leptolyngbya iicbica]|uniref:hypothetical protein n=1 Tax=Leptolyngbya iicbica TaxID=3161580 RepID=UPI0013EECF0E|nr:hypothetical protein [Leptolyngbya sp. LK]
MSDRPVRWQNWLRLRPQNWSSCSIAILPVVCPFIGMVTIDMTSRSGTFTVSVGFSAP